MMQSLLYAILRTTAWILIILGVIFTILNAYLLGLPGLVIGSFLLWVSRSTLRVSSATANFCMQALSEDLFDNPAYNSLNKIDDPTSPYYIADDTNGSDPLCGINDHLEDRGLDSRL